MEISLQEYINSIPYVSVRPRPVTSSTTPSSNGTTTTSGSSLSKEAADASGTTVSRSDDDAAISGGSSAEPVVVTSSTSSSICTTTTSGSISCDVGVDTDPVAYLHEVIHGDPAISPLTDAERKVISSAVGRLNWAARQGRFDLSFGTSLVQQLAGQGRGEALKWVNTVVKHAREAVVLKVRDLQCTLQDVVVLSAKRRGLRCNAEWGQSRWHYGAVREPRCAGGQAPVCILEAVSSKVQRVVRCSMSAEVSSLAAAFQHGGYVRAVFVELVNPQFQLSRWKISVAAWPHVLVTDARTGCDAVNSGTLPTDRKIAIDVGVLRQGLIEDGSGCRVRWVPGCHMRGDGLTKWYHNGVLTQLVAAGSWSLNEGH
eukprot:s5458_g2.t1